MSAAILTTIISQTAAAAEVQLVNLSGQTIDRFYISPCGAQDWGPNQLEGFRLWSSRSFNVANISPGCYDVMVMFPPWTECIITNLALRRGIVWTLTKSTATQAVVGDCNIAAGIASNGRQPWHWGDRQAGP